MGKDEEQHFFVCFLTYTFISMIEITRFLYDNVIGNTLFRVSVFNIKVREGFTMIISERIFQILKEKGISQKDFAMATGIPQSTISDWKGKHVNPAADKIMVICDVLDISPSELLTGTDDSSKWKVDFVVLRRDSDEYRILRDINELPAHYRERVIGYVDALKMTLIE